MMHESKSRIYRIRVSLGLALVVGLATFGAVSPARASSAFPAALQKALTKKFPGVTFCVPTCVACHLTTAGGPGNLNKFGDNLYHQPTFPNLLPGNGGADDHVQKALDTYFAATPASGLPQALTAFPPPDVTRQSYDADSDGISDYDELARLDSPSLPGAEGVAAFCPSDAATYGCFARVAAAPPPADRVGLFAAGLAALGLAVLRRRKRAPRVS